LHRGLADDRVIVITGENRGASATTAGNAEKTTLAGAGLTDAVVHLAQNPVTALAGFDIEEIVDPGNGFFGACIVGSAQHALDLVVTR